MSHSGMSAGGCLPQLRGCVHTIHREECKRPGLEMDLHFPKAQGVWLVFRLMKEEEASLDPDVDLQFFF